MDRRFICSGCGKEKTATAFHSNCSRRNGLDKYCRRCDATQRYRCAINPDTTFQTCRTCDDLLPLSEYDPSRNSPLGYTNRCRQCRRQHQMAELRLRLAEEWREPQQPDLPDDAFSSC